MILYLKSRNNLFNATGEFLPQEKKFILKKGSVVSEHVATSPTFIAGKVIEKQRKKTVKNNKTISDISFKSASTAANFVTGRSTNGLIAWKNEKGIKLKELLKHE